MRHRRRCVGWSGRSVRRSESSLRGWFGDGATEQNPSRPKGGQPSFAVRGLFVRGFHRVQGPSSNRLHARQLRTKDGYARRELAGDCGAPELIPCRAHHRFDEAALARHLRALEAARLRRRDRGSAVSGRPENPTFPPGTRPATTCCARRPLGRHRRARTLFEMRVPGSWPRCPTPMSGAADAPACR